MGSEQIEYSTEKGSRQSMGKVVVIGAGLAGLTCAKVLRGQRDVLVLEKSDGPGGRVRTDKVDGFRLDRGFQVLFTAYPKVQQHLDLGKLDPRPYRPGAMLARPGWFWLLGDPLRDLAGGIPSLLNPLASFGDKLKVLQLRAELARRTPEQVFQEGLGGSDCSVQAFLQRYGFSAKICQHFFYPFFRGILLDPDLASSARLFAFYFKMMAEGSIVTPALGMGELARQLAGHLSPEQIRYQTQVERILAEDGKVRGIRTANGEEIPAEWVVCAADAPQARAWQAELCPQAPTPIPTPGRAVTCLYFCAPFSLTRGGYLHLNATGQGWINHWVQLTHISPALAPPGQHLYSVVVLGDPPLGDEELAQACRAELQTYFPVAAASRSDKAPLEQLRLLRVYRIPFAQFVQPPGFQQHLVPTFSGLPGLLWAGEYTHQSSIEGALRSGEQAAAWILQKSA
ncbi:NAD(P)/FAD-dependent oxidoreductase [Synechococcus sp. W55.1]|uniref:NAD(P)/FAD-dependent oxidoreductase n=2 Tax=unclassified Synechococcus TaxID=2626047 RepID=UPI0039C21D36